MTKFINSIESLLNELNESWDYEPFPRQDGIVVYLGFDNRMAYHTACGILAKNLEPDKWAIKGDEDRIAIFARRGIVSSENTRFPPLNTLRHFMSAIGYKEGDEWWVEST